MQFSLRQKFLIPLLILIVLGMGVSSGISYFKAKDALEDALITQL